MIITPYGDSQAHGTIANTFIFVRYRGIVYAKPYRIPFDPKTPDQINQRQVFLAAIKSWNSQDSRTKSYYNIVTAESSINGINLFVQKYIFGQLPSTQPMELHDIVNLSIGTTRATVLNGWTFSVHLEGFPPSLGSIADNENLFYDGSASGVDRQPKINIIQGTQIINILRRDNLIITYNGDEMITVFLPDIDSNITLYISEDGSTYYNKTMTALACAAGF